MTLGKIYTLTEVAEHLRLTNRAVAKIARAHGLCMEAGRTLMFTEGDVEGIKEVMRVAPKEAARLPMKPPPSDYQLSKSLRELTRKRTHPSGSQKLRKLALQRSERPSHKRLLKEEFGED